MQKIIPIIKKVDTTAPERFYAQTDAALAAGEKRFIITANPEIIMMGRDSGEMYALLTEKAAVIPDGIGVVKAIGILGGSAVRNAGIDLVTHLLETADSRGLRLFVYGTRQSVLDSFAAICAEKYPGIGIAGLYNGYDSEADEVRSAVLSSGADIILTALGTPKQEIFINSFFDALPKGVCVGIGGSIDVLSGNVRRAPEFFIRHNLEWLYRITTQPKRLGRFFRSNVKFVFILLGEILGGGNRT